MNRMSGAAKFLRPLTYFTLTAAGLAALVWVLSMLVGAGVARPEAEVLASAVPTEMSTAERIRNLPREPVSLVSDLKVAPAAQAPMLDALVEAGQLPPLRERLPENPLVLRGFDGAGSYGGQWMRIATGTSDINQIARRLSYHAPIRWSPMGEPIVPHVAESFEASDDLRVFTIRLRAGHRWSDGVPFTADDVIFWWEREVNDDRVSPMAPPPWILNAGQPPRFELVDAQTFRVIYDEPNALFKYQVASYGYTMFESPRHYLEPYHPDGGDPELIASALAAYRLPNARSLYTFQKDPQNPLHPRLWPWIYRSFRSNPPLTFVRNPYYFAIDEAGRQLPNLDAVRFELRRAAQVPLEVANGKVSMQLRNLSFDDLTEYMSRRESSGIKVLLWDSASGSDWVINPNLNRRADADDPAGRWKAEYMGDVRFRRALSVAINRKRIIDSEYSGLVEPMQTSPARHSPFFNETAAKLYTEYDPQQAERLLDDLGFLRPSPGAVRRTPDGMPLTFFLDYTAFTGRGPADFVVEDWAAVGVNVIAQERARPLFWQRLRSREADMVVWEGGGSPLISAGAYMPADRQSSWATAWGTWYTLGGFYGLEVTDGRAIAPPDNHPVRKSYEIYDRIRQGVDPKEQVELVREMVQISAEQLYTIGISEAPPQVLVTDRRMRNVPENALSSYAYGTPGNAAPETFYLEGVSTAPELAATLAASIIEPELRPGGDELANRDADVGQGGAWLRRVVLIAALGGLVLLGLRYRFIGGRLLLMIPTLAVLSLLVFTIIQAPPGDYLTSRLMELQEQGGSSAAEEVAELRELFRLDEPFWSQYARWVGLTWFTSFDSGDTGLLQGNLGRSMATSQPVNFIVGDRVLLTVLISAGTILFTWSLALPIGIYSAVRQYSAGDYVLTFVGFLGMSMPSFLLALILMTLAGVSGLFSAEYQAQPYWDFGKVLDLLKHVWVPVLVLGVGGTASMIRVMRANLLDELRKPYVVTARAKGVRPMKLLVKYPVRLALNPFVSSIGGLFPQLVSGGAVVAMVLALPTVGPLLLEALLLEDMFLAGSMLMVLSLLGIIGTLVSDLLLLWLDPRIRFEGGSR